jgi:hypothetical protein
MKSTDLFQKLNIPNLDTIQKEALSFFDKNPQLIRHDSNKDYFVHVPFDEFPVLKKFLEDRAKIEINETSVYFIPPHSKSEIHIDGLKKDNGKVPEGMMISHQYVLIIPIANYEKTTSYWYNNEDVKDVDESIRNHIREQFPYNFYVSFVKTGIKLEPIGSTRIDTATFIKSNIYHQVDNEGDNTRMAFVIRFRELEYYESLDCVIEYQDLID